jgi:hypothetical protein
MTQPSPRCAPLWISASFVVLLGACGDSAGSGDTSSSTAESSSSTGEPAPLTHGAITLEFRRAESEATNPFVGAATIEVTMVYQDCLVDFYDANPNLHQDGLLGARIFGGAELDGEGWLDRLCAPTLPNAASCTIESISQTLAVAHLLTVRYTLEDDLEDRSLQFGPIPNLATTGCDPVMRMTSAGASKGFDAAGDQSFVVESFAPEDATTDQAEPIVIRVAAVE